MKKGLISILALCTLVSVGGCDSLDSKPYYNVNYAFDIGTHKYNVYVLKDDSKETYYENSEDMYDTFVVPMSNYHYIALTYRPMVEINGKNVEVQSEFYKNTSTLYVYGGK